MPHDRLRRRLAPPFCARFPWIALATFLGSPCALADDSGSVERTLDPIAVTATRQAQRSFDLPASIDIIGRGAIEQGQPMVNLSETLLRVPGIVAQNRQNYAQDLQISSRGFGARSTFGVRGIRLYQDEIPVTMPDGQGQTGSFQLLTAERIEVLRGPFSTLYGNASGGVITVFTESGTPRPALTFTAGGGSFGTWTAGTRLTGTQGGLGYVVAANRFATDGYRDHSAAERTLAVAKLTFALAERTRSRCSAPARTSRNRRTRWASPARNGTPTRGRRTRPRRRSTRARPRASSKAACASIILSTLRSRFARPATRGGATCASTWRSRALARRHRAASSISTASTEAPA